MSQAPTARPAAAAVDRTAGYGTDRPDVRAHVPAEARSILDLGCSGGALGARLTERGADVRVLGVELDPEASEVASSRLDRVVTADVESFLATPDPPEAPFDCVIAADVLEHLVDPWSALSRAVELVRPGGTVVVSVPNVLFWQSLGRVVLTRRWPRDPQGVLDGTHLRWFSTLDAVDLLRQAGLRGIEVEPRYFREGAALRRRQLLARTPLAPFLAAQNILTGLR